MNTPGGVIGQRTQHDHTQGSTRTQIFIQLRRARHAL